jgi:hypothetical protein
MTADEDLAAHFALAAARRRLINAVEVLDDVTAMRRGQLAVDDAVASVCAAYRAYVEAKP